jgi:hypothetical protein
MSKRLEDMRRKPKGDWRIADVEAVCSEFGVSCKPPTGGGSHYRLFHPRLARKLTIPFNRPIKLYTSVNGHRSLKRFAGSHEPT